MTLGLQTRTPNLDALVIGERGPIVKGLAGRGERERVDRDTLRGRVCERNRPWENAA